MGHRRQATRSDVDRGQRARGALVPQAAFTLFELMVVLLILAIVATLAAPMFGQTKITRLRSAAEVLVADLGFAQVESIAHGDSLRVVVFDQNDNSYRIATAAEPTTPITNPVGNLPYVMTVGTGRASELDGVTIQSYSLGGDDQIQFGIYGQLDQTADATVTLGLAGKSVTVTVNATNGEASIGSIE